MPLCTTTMSPVQSRCGCAFSSVGRPCVAQRVWPMPNWPSSGCLTSASSSFESLPALRLMSRWPLRMTATPAESYPRYSSFRNPSISTGTSGFGPTYPTIPHMSGPLFQVLLLAKLRGPLRLVFLPSPRDRERIRRHVLDDRRPRRDVGALANVNRRDELRVAADEDAILDDGGMLRDPVVVARDRAGADVDARADRRVSKVREVIRFRSLAHRGLLELDEISDVRPLADDRLRPDV